MHIINAGYEFVRCDLDDPKVVSAILEKIEACGRTAYQSEHDITTESAEKFSNMLVELGHESVLEHAFITVKFIVDRGISHELVRHRIASYTQESTRYCNYSKEKFGNEITVIEPVWYAQGITKKKRKLIRDILNKLDGYIDFEQNDLEKRYANWYLSCMCDEHQYFKLLELGATPQEARNVLPTSLKTEVVMTANIREWRSVLKLRAAGERGLPHPQMLEVMVPLLNELKLKLPVLFYDIKPLEIPEYGSNEV